ncbi:iron(III) transport system ATP-binding protein [Planomicrobium sp. HSC-17F08]|nr:iron(III) transport system ATP-binding protein [Planomicrobium sp. HSC-17F08]
MEHIKIQNVSKFFGESKAIDDISFSINQGEFFTLLGPSGCGKTTLLRTLAGFYQQEEGNIFFDQTNISKLPAHKRNIGMVFQNYAIFPHMSVFDNVAYGLKARKVKKEQIETRVTEALEMVELGHLKDRSPSALSGGQQQRVALARAIVIHPGLLLMDEPLSNLDAKLRVKMREDIKHLQNSLNITTIYVTHDQEEALAVSDRIAVMKDGVVQQIGKPHEIYLTPSNKFVASFIGSTNFLKGNASSQQNLPYNTVCTVEGIKLPSLFNKEYTGEVLYSVRPEQVKLLDINEADFTKLLKGKIIESTFLGQTVTYKVELESGTVIDVHEHSISFHNLRSNGDEVAVNLNPDQSVIFTENGEEVLNERNSRKEAKVLTV